MLTTIVAVLGTLSGALTAGLMQARVARTARNDARADDRRRDAVDAVTTLAVTLSDHRRAMWELGNALLVGDDADRVQALRDEAHRTRGAITAPAVRVQLIAPAVQEAARTALQATYAMRNPPSLGDLESLRHTALDAHDALVAASARHLAV